MKTNLLQDINLVLVNVSKALRAERSTVYLLNEEQQTLDSVVSEGIRNDLISMPVTEGIAGMVAQTKRAQLVNDVRENDYFNAYYDSITGFNTRKAICVPILSGPDTVIGVLQSLNKKEGDFTHEDITLLQGFAEAFALAIKNEALYQSTEAVKNDIATLLKVSSSINSELDLNNLIELIIRKATEITQSDRSSFFLLDRETNTLWTKFGLGLGSKTIKTRKGLANYVAQTEQPIIENSPYENPHFDPTVDLNTGYKTNSIISVPVFNATRELIGVIQSMNKCNGRFTQKDLFILNGFATQISIAVQNSTLFEEVSNIKNYLDVLFENLDNGILTIGRNGVIKTVNKRFCDILGTQPEALVGVNYKALQGKEFHFLSYSDHTFQFGERLLQQNIETISLEGRKLVLHFHALPMKDKDGKNIGVINVIHDVTAEERVRENLTRYLPAHVVEEIIHKDDLSVFNGKYIRSSILFSDIRNFTSITEKLEAIETVNLLNYYFDVMVSSILKFDGVLDKLIGDAIMATFGVPFSRGRDALHAAQTALEMIENLCEVNANISLHTMLNIGIGIATGEVIAGNIGSQKRFDYTVIGDSVNLAARLEGLTKFYGIPILVCEQTYQEIADQYICREVDSIRAKGKKEPVTVYTVVTPTDQPLSKRTRVFLDLYHDGLHYYRDKQFLKAIRSLKSALLLCSTDHPSRILLERSKQLYYSPPVIEWSGVWTFTEK